MPYAAQDYTTPHVLFVTHTHTQTHTHRERTKRETKYTLQHTHDTGQARRLHGVGVNVVDEVINLRLKEVVEAAFECSRACMCACVCVCVCMCVLLNPIYATNGVKSTIFSLRASTVL